MNGRSWLHPLTGVLFILVLAASFIVMGDEPPSATDDSLQELTDYYADNEDQVFISGILGGLAAAVLIFFAGYLYKRLTASGANATAIVAFAGLVVVAIAGAIDSTITIALTELVNGDETADPGAVQALGALYENDFVPFGVGVATFLWGAGVAIVRHGALPAWIGWVAIVGGITALTPAFPASLIIAALLVLVSSIMFSREESSGGAAAPAA